MHSRQSAQVAIVDYGLGNLYSVKHACSYAGITAGITSSPSAVVAADAIILPGVGAFGDAMAALTKLGLVSAIREAVASGRPIVGICLGMQLLMTASDEFGVHEGLGIIAGRVVRFGEPREAGRRLKIPQIGWNGVQPVAAPGNPDPWQGTLLAGIPAGEPMYFVHSYVVQPADPRVVLSTTSYGDTAFCSSLVHESVFACQFHPERSGLQGLAVYRNIAKLVAGRTKETSSESVA